jgi:hypothetical protein
LPIGLPHWKHVHYISSLLLLHHPSPSLYYHSSIHHGINSLYHMLKMMPFSMHVAILMRQLPETPAYVAVFVGTW